MADIPKERLKGEPNDMYVVNGGVEITPNSYILCPQGKGKEIKENNPNATVIECEGKGINGYAKAFLSTIGYKQTDTNAFGFCDQDEVKKQRADDFLRIIKENGIPNVPHFLSKEETEESRYARFNREIAISHIIKDNGLINSEEDSTKILKDVLERNPLEYPIESKEVIEYIKNKMEEEGLDPTSIVDRKAIRSNEIIQQAVQKIVREKNNDGIKQIKDDFDKWAEERKAQEGNISLEEIYNKYEQHIKLFPTNGNIFADVSTELIKHTKEKNPEEAKKMGEEILVFALNERIKTDKEDAKNPEEGQEKRNKEIRIREIWDKVGKEIGLPRMMLYEGELRDARCIGEWPKVTTKGVEVLPPPPSKEEIIKLSKMPPPPPAPLPPPVAPPPPAPMINISDVKGAIGEVRKGEVVKARETLERTTNKEKEKSTEEREI